jgi:phospholipid/cholesterol/gamma-HCH transport system ATP-binding protein
MIRLEDIKVEGYEPISIEVGSGVRCAVIALSEHQKDIILRMLAGMRRPDEGRVLFDGIDVYSLSESDRVDLYRYVGFVWAQGGMLSNLKVWENIILPVEYHRGLTGDVVEEKVLGMLEALGVVRESAEGFLQSPPYALPAHQRMYAAFVREALMEPDLMIYDSIFDGLGPSSARQLKALASGFDTALEGRAALYLVVDEVSLKVIDSDIVIDLRSAHEGH